MAGKPQNVASFELWHFADKNLLAGINVGRFVIALLYHTDMSKEQFFLLGINVGEKVKKPFNVGAFF